jgi:hypothetical protein
VAAPIIPDQDALKEPAGLREDVLLDDIDAKLKEQEAAQKKEAEEAEAKRKAELEAKARQDLLASQGDDPRVKALQEALRISEEARKRQESLAAPAPAPAPEVRKKLTREEVNELYQKDPLAAIEYMQGEALSVATENLERRLGPLMSGNASMGENAARQRYPEEFELFGSAMKEYIERLPDKSVMSRPEAWDDLVAWFRGRPGNFEKLVEHRQKKSDDSKAEEARKAQAAGAGAHTRSEMRAPVTGGKVTLDETQREIARALNPGLSPDKAYEEYVKWMKVTNV